jgi:hypothetical protein
MHDEIDPLDPIDAIPDPAVVRERLIRLSNFS